MATIDLRDIVGFGASKGPLEGMQELRSLAERLPGNPLEASKDNLDHLLRHNEIRVSINRDGRSGDDLHRFGWEHGYWLSNSGGSHHLAAAIVVAREINAYVAVSAPLHDHRLDVVGAISLARIWHSFLIPFDDFFHVTEALESDRVGFFVTRAPCPFRDELIVHFERGDARSQDIRRLFQQHFPDVSQTIRETYERQKAITREAT